MAASFDNGTHIAKGEGLQQIIVGYNTCLDFVTNATAVHNNHITVQHGLKCIGDKICQAAFAIAHQTLAGLGVVALQLNNSLTHGLIKHGLVSGHFPGNNLLHLGIIANIGLAQSAADFTIGADNQLAHGLELGAGLGDEHILAHIVFDIFTLNSFMGMSIYYCIHTTGIGSNALAIPILNGAIEAQMTHYKHIVSAIFSGSIDALLQSSVKLASCFVLVKAVDIISLPILKVSWPRRN